jgi:hypothetical protein
MSCCSTTSHPCAVWHQIEGSPDTVAALLHSAIESPCTLACMLCMTGRPALYYHHLAMSMSCMYLMLPICHVWLPYTHLMRCLLCVPGEVMMSLMSDIMGIHRHDSKVGGPCRVSRPAEYFPFACGS